MSDHRHGGQRPQDCAGHRRHRLHRRRLVPRLLDAGHRVKVLVRSPDKIAGVPWFDDVEVVRTSLDDAAALEDALRGVDVLYYLVHSMAAGSGFEAKEKSMAELVATAAAAADVQRIVYLGGLHPRDTGLSTHMRSREAVGEVFLSGPVDAIVFQAGVVIGSGSASFEMIRHLAETLPVMPAPSWVRNRIEAIAVRDVLHYLVGAASLKEQLNRTFDIGSRDVLSYAGMMKEYAAEAGLPRRLVLALPIPAPRLAGPLGGAGNPHSAVHVRPAGAVAAARRRLRRTRHRQLHRTARRRPDRLPHGRGPRAGQGTRRTGRDHVGQRRRGRRSAAERPRLGRTQGVRG